MPKVGRAKQFDAAKAKALIAIWRDAAAVQARQALITVEGSTLRSYRSELLYMAWAFNTVSQGFQTPTELLRPAPSAVLVRRLFVHVGENVTPEAYAVFTEYRMSVKEKNLKKLRAAISLALRAAGKFDWAISPEIVKRTNALEKRTRIGATPTKVSGSICVTKLRELLRYVKHPNPAKCVQTLRLAIEIQQKAALRIGELRDIRPRDVRVGSLYLFDTKTDTATTVVDEAHIKRLDTWPSGRRAMELLTRRAILIEKYANVDDFLFTDTDFTEQELNQAIQAVATLRRWDPTLHWKSHSLRHGGVFECKKEMADVWDEKLLAERLLMCTSNLNHYSLSNEARHEKVVAKGAYRVRKTGR
eukprot:GILI01024177.1.p1 GENE.GILI01024177.1~~GILI01024177.1.p1  ORF type:complete len:360 (-),score=7.95 GILI01024177.1:63-1142(-)